MPPEDHLADHPTQTNPYAADDVIAILRENHWLTAGPTPEQTAWAERAAHCACGPEAQCGGSATDGGARCSCA